ncbi:MAG: hypothetical protein K2X77_23955 [Candidatus Obscuribacterales bacterium]|nr:hypothetical protein [Candidatus Obscuribacterales bacterium]
MVQQASSRASFDSEQSSDLDHDCEPDQSSGYTNASSAAAEKTSNLTVDAIFQKLEDTLSSYEERPQQIEFAKLIERAITARKTGIFEAGTGTGKSLAALIPAALSRKRVVVSTATIALQEQYISKDIPCLQTLLPFDIRAALFKGRGNYVSIRRYEDHKLQNEVEGRLAAWIEKSKTGDRAELDFVPNQETWNEIDSDSDDCLRTKCPTYTKCFYFKSKREAEVADIIVVNHALLLIDAMSGGNILPPYEVLIVDEAHQLPDIASKSFSLGISLRGIQLLAAKAAKQVACPAHLVHNMEESAEELFGRVHQAFPLGKTRLRKPLDGISDLLSCIYVFRDWLSIQEFEHILDVDNQREKLKLKAKKLFNIASTYIRCLNLLEQLDDDWVFWIEKSEKFARKTEIVAAPLNVADYIQQYLFDKEGLESSIWMSATLATVGDDPFQYFKGLIGCSSRVVQEQVASPFNYARQSALYLPSGMPEPNSRDFNIAAVRKIEDILELSRGRAFILFTSYTAMNACFQAMSEQIAFPTKKQGEMPRNRLLDWFRETPNAVLFATASFWEGVSVDGDQLSAVIIDRIPFQSPDDPIYEARCDLLKEEEGLSWFSELALPYAIMRLKQGVGRLIRTKTDRGIVAILDPRVTSKAYGRAILSCLPPMTVVRSIQNASMIDDLLP